MKAGERFMVTVAHSRERGRECDTNVDRKKRTLFLANTSYRHLLILGPGDIRKYRFPHYLHNKLLESPTLQRTGFPKSRRGFRKCVSPPHNEVAVCKIVFLLWQPVIRPGCVPSKIGEGWVSYENLGRLSFLTQDIAGIIGMLSAALLTLYLEISV
jgi:hypothetical protein